MANRTGCVVVLCLLANLAGAAPVALEPYDASGKLTVALPRGWKVTADLDKGVIAAQQDASRNDAAAVLVVILPTATATEDALLDLVASSVSKDLKVARRGALAGGHGRTVVADGTIDGIKVRVGAVAVVASGSAIVCLLAAKTGDFEPLGGLELVGTILASLRAHDATEPAPAGNGAPTTQPIQQPTLDSYGHLVVPGLARKLALVELAGEWRQDDSAISTYVNSTTGSYAGFSAIATTENWTLDAKGNVSSSFVGTTAGNGGAHQVVEKRAGAATLAPNMVLTLSWKGRAEARYLVRGWVELPAMTVMVLNGPWYQGGVPSDVLADPKIGANLDAKWVRIRAKK